ncbi:unnamed protein product [Gordionus sp. m RMFG-2023]|uniref:heterogeneous nuclear ribonucleoprotein A1-like n=1 Tax=Gordionus sp. m RMFG-2023 TaxID=3053472 RepID=UPI0030E0163A
MNSKSNHAAYDAAESHRKIFIGGLSVTTTDDTLREFYTQWGEVIDCIVMKDPQTKKSRGFGFITYKEPEGVDQAMQSRPHNIDGRDVDPKRAVPRGESGKNEMLVTSTKLYVGGVKDGVPIEVEDLKNHFSQYGKILECDIKLDSSGKKRGFAFIAFDDYDAVDKAVLHKPHIINNVKLAVNKAMSKDERNKMTFSKNNNAPNMPMNNRRQRNEPNFFDDFDYNFQNMMFGNGFNMGGPMNGMGPMNPMMMGMGNMGLLGEGPNNPMPLMGGFDNFNYDNSFGGGPMRNPRFNNNNMKNNNRPYNTGNGYKNKGGFGGNKGNNSNSSRF